MTRARLAGISTERAPETTKSQHPWWHHGVAKGIMFSCSAAFILTFFAFRAVGSGQTPRYIFVQPPRKMGDGNVPDDVQKATIEEQPGNSTQDPVEQDGHILSQVSGDLLMKELEKGVINISTSNANATSDGEQHENEDDGIEARGAAADGDESSSQMEDMRNSAGVIVPSKENVNRLSREQISQILSQPAGLHGFQKKVGMLDPFQWMEARKNDRWSLVRDWFVKAVSFSNGEGPIQPPASWPACEIMVNHHYRFIWIKGQKVGGTTLRNKLGWICGDGWRMPADADMSHCTSQEFSNPNVTEAEARKWWSEYFVFTVVRNPFSRFASGYTYLGGMTKSCPPLTFAEVCTDPFLPAKMCATAGCCFGGAQAHHVHHMMEQSPCLFNGDGQLPVDFVGRTETLAQDFGTIVEEINGRRREGVPKLEAGALREHANSNPKAKEDYGSVLFEENPQCLLQVQKNFANDLQGLQFQLL